MATEEQKTVLGFAVELYFDADTEKAIRAFRDELYAAGVTPVLGKMGDRPHVSLAVFADLDVDCVRDLTQNLASDLSSFDVELSAIGTFPTSDNVLFLYPVPSEKLLKVHRDFHEQLICNYVRSSAYYHPGNWVPHCTVEFELEDKVFAKAIKTAHQLFKPIKGTFQSMGFVSFRPIEYISEFQLKRG